jgi:hypothetical protein
VADLGYMLTIARGIPDEKTRNAVVQIVTHLSGNIRIGVPEHQTRAVNLQAYFLQSTTPASTGEFTIAHGLPTTPHYAIALLELDRTGAQTVPLEVTRPADAARLYLKSTSTGAPITLLVEP